MFYINNQWSRNCISFINELKKFSHYYTGTSHNIYYSYVDEINHNKWVRTTFSYQMSTSIFKTSYLYRQSLPLNKFLIAQFTSLLRCDDLMKYLHPKRVESTLVFLTNLPELLNLQWSYYNLPLLRTSLRRKVIGHSVDRVHLEALYKLQYV